MNDKVQTRNSPMDLELYEQYAQYLAGEFVPDIHYNTWLYHLGTFCTKIVDAVRKHRDFRGDDRCWEDDEELYKQLPEKYTPPERDTTVELDNCEKFIKCRRNPATTYISPQRRIEELEAENKKYYDNVKAVLDIVKSKYPRYAVSVQEGGGKEDILASLAVTVSKLSDAIKY